MYLTWSEIQMCEQDTACQSETENRDMVDVTSSTLALLVAPDENKIFFVLKIWWLGDYGEFGAKSGVTSTNSYEEHSEHNTPTETPWF